MWLLLFSCMLLEESGSTESHEQRLTNKIFENYNKEVRPIAKSSDPIDVTLNPALYSIVDTDEAVESITIVLWFRMDWKDAYLAWNSSEYGGLQELNIPISEIWYPDIFVGNTIKAERLIPDEKNYADIESDGAVSISIVQLLTMHCQYHIAMFPFDIQNCTTTVFSWMYGDTKVGILYKTPADDSVYNENSEWNLVSMTARHKKFYYVNGTVTYTFVYYDIVIQRKPIYYMLTFVLPCFMITTIGIIGIFAPFNDSGERQEKVSMGLTTLLTMVFMLTSIADKMPKSSEGLPLLGAYIMMQIAISALTSLIAVIILYLNQNWTAGEPIPAWIRYVTGLNRMISDSSAAKTHNSSDSKLSSKAQNGHDGKTINVNARTQQQTIILKNVASFLGQIVNYLLFSNKEDDLRREWQFATQRLDLLLMIIFLAINSIFTVSLLITGYSNLQI